MNFEQNICHKLKKFTDPINEKYLKLFYKMKALFPIFKQFLQPVLRVSFCT